MDKKLNRQDNQQSKMAIKSKNEMTVLEKRMTYLVINQLNNSSGFESNEIRSLNFTLAFNQLKESNYERIRNSVSNLPSRTLTLISYDNKENFKQIIPFPLAKVTGTTIEITLAKNVLPHFVKLKNNFTKHELSAALSLNSIYSQKMYEFLNHWKNKQELLVSLGELQKLFNAENYRPCDFIINCVEKAVKEVNLKTNLHVVVTIKKECRSISAIQFQITSKAIQKQVDVKQALPSEIAPEKQISTKKNISLFDKLTPVEVFHYINRISSTYKFTEQQKEKIMNSNILFNRFVKLDKQITGGKIKKLLNPTAYMSGFLFLPD
ncbi:MAG: RepB family plasmid replication initiator protein [Sphingobacteriaceae bacterium]|nr:MAG: RepB family plasmid replication initiator protein [Sphingobacteriaceae bacterium]